MPETRQPTDDGAEPFLTNLERRVLKGTIVVLGSFALVGLAGAVLSSDKQAKDKPAPATELETAYHYNELDGLTEESFLQLEYLSPDTIDTVNWPQSPQLERQFGITLQADISQVSRKLFAMDAELPNRPVDEYDLAQALIPQDVQAEMRLQGINLAPVAPVDCNIDVPGNYDPLDYSGSLPRDFTVTLNSPDTDKQSMTIPLGAAQHTTAEDSATIFSTTYDYMIASPIDTLPCWAFPQSIPRSDLKQVY